MKFTAEQLNLFEIEPEDSRAIYGTPGIPFLVAVTSPVTLSVNMTAGKKSDTHTQSTSTPPS